jgi:hypothetical protein
MKKKESVTSVKIESEMWDEFKLESFKKKFTLHKLVNRAIHLYLNDPEFQNMITNYSDNTDNKEK